MPVTQSNSPIGCGDNDHGNHHHGNCGPNTCGVGQYMTTDDNGLTECNNCPVDTFQDSNNHTIAQCTPPPQSPPPPSPCYSFNNKNACQGPERDCRWHKRAKTCRDKE